MKRIVSFVLITLMLCGIMTACSNQQKQTNLSLNLSVYDSFNYESLIKLFKENYPEVSVNLNAVSKQDMSYEDYSKQLISQILSGKGPDVIFIDSGLMGYCDINKLIYSGVFADMRDEFDNDPSFDVNEYNSNVFNAGIFDEKRYIIPEKYNLHILLSSKSILNETGFNLSEENYLDFMRECVRIVSEDNKMRVFASPHYMENFIDYLALPLIDYQNGEVNLSDERLKVATELYKTIYNQDIDIPKSSSHYLFAGSDALSKKTALFENYGKHLSYSLYLMNAMSVNSFDTPIMLPLRGTQGEVTARITHGFAVNNNSSNKKNAANFIKLGISEEWFENVLDNPAYLVPVKKSSAKNLLTEYQADISTNVWSFDNLSLKPLSKAFCDEYYDISQSVTNVYFKNSCGEIFFESMKPFFENKKSYDECITDAQERLEIYISE